MEKTLLTFGHGYTAQALARLLIPQGWRIIGTTRDANALAPLSETGITPMLWPGTDMADAIGKCSHVLMSVAPGEQGDPVLATYRDQIAAAPNIQWLGYLSTIGVYGDHQGAWVDENTPLTPATKRGKLRVTAEAQWQELAEKTSLTLGIFRLAGIYGPGRGPFSKVQSGKARRIIKPGQVFSRIHVDDIAQTLAAAINQPRSGAIYNVCDDNPAPPQDVIAYAANLLNLPIPPAIDYDTADLSPMARSFYAESKKVRNDLIKSELGVSLQYPDFKTGLQALLNTA